MKSRAMLVVTGIGCLLLTRASLAQIEMPLRDGVKQSLPAQVLPKDGEPWRVWIACEGYRPRTRWSEKAAAEGFRALKFMERLSVLYRHQGDEGNYLLVGEPKVDNPSTVERALGWMREDYAVQSAVAKQVPATGVFRKAMLITRVERDGVSVDEEFPLMDAPGGGNARRKFKLFNVFFVYGETHQGQYDPTKEDSVLLGNDQYFDVTKINADASVERAPGDVVLGWVPKSKTVAWNTREAVRWDRPSTLVSANPRRTLVGQVFENARTAKAFLDKTAGQEKDIALFRERLDETGESQEFAPHHMRYPIFEPEPDELELPGPNGTKLTLPKKYLGNELLKIGCIGGFGSMSPQEVEDLRRRLGLISDMVSATEILFIIDDTGSMFEYFPRVANLVRSITAHARSVVGVRSVNIGVAFYDDTDAQPAGWNPVRLYPQCFPLKSAASEGRRIADFVEQHSAVSGGDEPELVFRGINEAVAEADFSTNARKLVIVVGDNGDKFDNPANFDDEAAIVSRLYGDGTAPIEFMAVQVGSATENKFTIAFRDQTKEITKQLNAKGDKDEKTLATYVNAPNTDFGRVLALRYVELDAKAKAIQKELEGNRAGNFQSAFANEYNAILEKAGIDLSKLQQQKGAQSFREGYTWRYSPQEPALAQVRIQLQLNRADVTGIIDYMNDLVSAVTPILGTKPKLIETLGKLVADATGEEADPNLSFEEQVLKRKGLVASSPFLKKPIGADFSPRLTTAELLEIGHRLDLLRDILAGQKRNWAKEMTPDGPKYEGGAAVPYERKFSLPGSRVDWYWIDVEEELP